jgi:hypothetical protein
MPDLRRVYRWLMLVDVARRAINAGKPRERGRDARNVLREKAPGWRVREGRSAGRAIRFGAGCAVVVRMASRGAGSAIRQKIRQKKRQNID